MRSTRTALGEEIRATRIELGNRIDQTNARLDRVEGRLEGVEGVMVELATQQRVLVRHIETHVEGDIADLRRRVSDLEQKVG